MVTSTPSMFNLNAYILINSDTTHSFVSCNFAAQSALDPIPLSSRLEAYTPIRNSLWPMQMLKGCLFLIEGLVIEANLIIIELYNLDVILVLTFWQ